MTEIKKSANPAADAAQSLGAHAQIGGQFAQGFSKKFQNDISLYEPIGTDRDGNEIVMLDVINSETPDFAEQLHLTIESEKMLHAVRERLSKREQIVVIFRYGLWGQAELTQQEIAGRLGISRSYVYRHIYCK